MYGIKFSFNICQAINELQGIATLDSITVKLNFYHISNRSPLYDPQIMTVDPEKISFNKVFAQCVLPLDANTIRVLHLEHGDQSDQVKGTLQLVETDIEPPQYDCVSYVWGPPESIKSAIVNGETVMIPKNLHDVLRHIRFKTKTAILWADAICINQSDLVEKSHQVASMAEIYRRCNKVHIWLGSPEPGSLTGNPFEFLEHFVTGRHFYDLPGFYRDESTGLWMWRENEACSNILNDFLQVVKSPWWTRAWTVQECLLPRETLVRFGTWTVKWDFMLKAEFMKNSHGDGPAQCCGEAANSFNPYQLPLINEWMWHPSRAHRFMGVLRGESSPPWFWQSIFAFSHRECENSRDKIYSMLALATDPIYQDLIPNYEEDPASLYIETFIRMVRETNCNFTCFMGGGFGSPMAGLPSWVRDFSHTRPLGVVAVEERRIHHVTLYQASLAQPGLPSWNNNRELHYRGTYADKVKDVGPLLSNTAPVLREGLGQWLDLCKKVVGVCEPKVLRTAFLRVLCGDVCKTITGGTEFRRAREADFPHHAWDRFVDGDLSALDFRAYGWGLNFAIWGRCFFTTYSSKMGLCHPNTLPGDEVWLMRGVQVPFVVRPLQHADAGCAGKYSFRGDCFLNGIMDGELGEKERLTERPIIMI